MDKPKVKLRVFKKSTVSVTVTSDGTKVPVKDTVSKKPVKLFAVVTDEEKQEAKVYAAQYVDITDLRVSQRKGAATIEFSVGDYNEEGEFVRDYSLPSAVIHIVSNELSQLEQWNKYFAGKRHIDYDDMLLLLSETNAIQAASVNVWKCGDLDKELQ